LATRLVELALVHLGRIPTLVVDPSCGAGSFLLAAADVLVAHGVAPGDVLGRLAGCDVDPDALDHCREALRRWADIHGLDGDLGSRIVLHDPLVEATPFDGLAELVVGNPPFLAQRTSDTARSTSRREALRSRFGGLGPYVDDSAAFLLVGSDLLGPGGVCVMIQPQSFLSARDSSEVRDRLISKNDLVAMWADDTRHFDAEVEVCAPILRRPPVAPRRSSRDRAVRDVAVSWATSPAIRAVTAPAPGHSWGTLLAAAIGVPAASAAPHSDATTVLGDVSVVTAGFREEFYALAEAARLEGDAGWDPDAPLLVTCGMIDVARLDTDSARRLAGRNVVRPRLDVASLAQASPRVSRWATDRAVPKALVATQTRVPEAVADPSGRLVPVTPVIAVEPLPGSGIDPWHLVAALSAPSVAAAAAAERAGSGLSSGALRLTAAWARSVPLPVEPVAWSDAATVVRELQSCPLTARRRLLEELGRVADLAHGAVTDPDLLAWWLDRADRRANRFDRAVSERVS